MTIQYLVNDLSMCGQFNSLMEFETAIDRVMTIRGEILKRDLSLYCHRNLAKAMVLKNMPMSAAISHLTLEKRRAFMLWLASKGPYWEDEQSHNSDEWYDVNNNLVTDTGLAEAAASRNQGKNREVLSFDPSPWLHTPIDVVWEHLPPDQPIRVPNHWRLDTLLVSINTYAPTVIDSWHSLETTCRREFGRLTFGEKAFRPLAGRPFVSGASERIRYLLEVLNEFKGCFDDGGNRTAEGDALYALHFTGGKALFTDSSDGEKQDFRNDLHFPHPSGNGHLFCTWHGKVKTPQIRIHFTYPIHKDPPLYVMYVGPKITKY